MSNMTQIIDELKWIAENPASSIKETMRRTGKKAVGCFPIYCPEEVVYAAGLLPVGMWGGKRKGALADKYLQSFCCSIMRANTEQALSGDYDFLSGVIVTAFCDTLKCIIEDWKVGVPHLNIIPIVYPQNRKTQAAKEYFATELERIRKEMERIAGRSVTEQMLTDAVDLYDEYRAAMQEFTDLAAGFPHIFDAKTRHLVIKAASFMDKKDYTEKICELNCAMKSIEPEETNKKRIILTGILGEPTELLDIFTQNDMYVVADDIAQESRQFRTIAPKVGTAFQRMAERIALQDGCAFLFDAEKSRGGMLLKMMEKYNADAVVFLQLKFCDPEELDYPIIKKEMETAGVPMLYLETEQVMDSLEQYRTRIQSFAEMLG